MGDSRILLAYSDQGGNVYEYPGYEGTFRSGRRFVKADQCELIKLPLGSFLFSLPERSPVFYNRRDEDFEFLDNSADGDKIWAVSSFLSSGYLRTHLPAFIKREGAPVLPLWAYTGLVIIDGEFYVPALRIDEDPRSDYSLHQDDDELSIRIDDLLDRYPENRLVKQLSYCSIEYRCLCARNFFLSRFEAPIPTTPVCNAECIGCLSYQSGSEFCASQKRIGFQPTPEEIAEVVVYHVERVDSSVVSFGQGCEGEPLLRGYDLARAIEIVRERTDRGTININTNGSLPGMIERLIESGLDSIRVSLNSPTIEYYNRYCRPISYTFDDVLRSLEIAIKGGIFVSINLLFMPGFTDMESEVDALFRMLRRFPVNMIQTRNLNIDPDYYLDNIGFTDSNSIGIKSLVELIKEKFPSIKLGYYNPPKDGMTSGV